MAGAIKLGGTMNSGFLISNDFLDSVKIYPA
jgi:hypothetical protein